MTTPNDRKYAATHEWVKIDGDIATVGITDHAQAELGDVTFVELPEIGRRVDAGEACAEIESVKAASDIYAPIGGVVAEVNSALENAPETVNSAPYEGGWLFKLRDANRSELEKLLAAAAYDQTNEDK